MIILEKNKKRIKFELNREELLNINSVFREICYGIDLTESDFRTRIGEPKNVILDLFNKVYSLARTAVKEIRISKKEIQVLKTELNWFILELNNQDLNIIYKMFGVVFEELETLELETRMGTSKHELLLLQQQIKKILDD